MASDARLWAALTEVFEAAGVEYPAAQWHARRAVAVVRRNRGTAQARTGRPSARTWGPGEEIPYDVNRVLDLDGTVWFRLSTVPGTTLCNTWQMSGFDPDEHEPDCAGYWLTPDLLARYGPLTETRRRH